MALQADICPCGTGNQFGNCCGPFLSGKALPSTAEALMRSRYVAFHQKLPEYLAKTSHFTLLSPDFMRSQEEFMETHSWHGLKIEERERGGPEDKEGIVQFAAKFEGPNGPGLHRERSFFVREEGKWLFLRGEDPGEAPLPNKKVGRNDPCPCGSGKKFKKCHGR